MSGEVSRGGYHTTLSSLFLVPAQAHFQDMYYDSTHSSPSSSSSSSSSELLLAFSPIITSPFSQTNKRPETELVRWFGYIIFIIFYRWWLLFSYFLRQINRDDNIMQARRGDLGACSRACLFVVWYACLLAIKWMDGWMDRAC